MKCARLSASAVSIGWRVALHGVTSDSWPIAALYDTLGEYVGLVHVVHNSLVTRGPWDLDAMRSLVPLRKVYAQCALPGGA